MVSDGGWQSYPQRKLLRIKDLALNGFRGVDPGQYSDGSDGILGRLMAFCGGACKALWDKEL